MDTQTSRPLAGAAANSGGHRGMRGRAYSSTYPDAIQLRREDGRPVAELRGATVWKRIRASRHFLRTPPAIAFDSAILGEAAALGAELVEVEDSDTGAVYSTSLANFLRRGFPVCRGHGRQTALRLDAWQRRGPGEEVQLQLF